MDRVEQFRARFRHEWNKERVEGVLNINATKEKHVKGKEMFL